MQIIPTSRLPGQTFNVVLAGQNCTISLYWRQSRLYMDLSVGPNQVCQGAVCQNCVSILQSKSRFFSGSLHFFDLEGDRHPHWEGLNQRYFLVYVEPDESVPDKLRF